MSKRKLLLVFICVAMALPLMGAVLYFVILKGTITAQVVYGLVKLSMLAGPVVVVITLEKDGLRFASFDWKNQFRAIPLGLLAGGCIAALMLVLYEYSALGDYVNRFAGDVRQKSNNWVFSITTGHLAFFWRLDILCWRSITGDGLFLANCGNS